MPKMTDGLQMKMGDYKFLFSSNTVACKWMDNRSVLLSSSALEGMNDILSEKGSETKSLVPCPKVAKLYTSGMGGDDLMDQLLLHIVWMESHLLNFTSAFSLIAMRPHFFCITT